MKKLLVASLCSALVLGACALASNGDVKPQIAEASGMLIHVHL